MTAPIANLFPGLTGAAAPQGQSPVEGGVLGVFDVLLAGLMGEAVDQEQAALPGETPAEPEADAAAPETCAAETAIPTLLASLLAPAPQPVPVTQAAAPAQEINVATAPAPAPVAVLPADVLPVSAPAPDAAPTLDVQAPEAVPAPVAAPTAQAAPELVETETAAPQAPVIKPEGEKAALPQPTAQAPVVAAKPAAAPQPQAAPTQAVAAPQAQPVQAEAAPVQPMPTAPPAAVQAVAAAPLAAPAPKASEPGKPLSKPDLPATAAPAAVAQRASPPAPGDKPGEAAPEPTLAALPAPSPDEAAPAAPDLPEPVLLAADAPEALPAEPAQARAPVTLPVQGAVALQAAHPAPPPVVQATPHTVAKLAADVVSKVGEKTTRFDIALEPMGLGKVDVRLEISAKGHLTAAMSFDTPQAAAELRGRAGELRQALEQAGFDVSENSLSFDFTGHSGQDRRELAERQSRAWNGRAFQVAAEGLEDIYLTPNSLLRLGRPEAGGVDVRI